MVTTLPNLLTVSRILVIPVIVGMFYIDGPGARWVACWLFVAAAITDFFDGYFARRRNSVSSLGRFLDPIADKLLVGASLLMLSAFSRVHGVSVLPAVVIMLREILVSGLREFLAELRVGVPVSRLAKWKTGIQMTAIPVLMVGDKAPSWIPAEPIGILLLWLAAVLTLITGWDYLQAGLKHMARQPSVKVLYFASLRREIELAEERVSPPPEVDTVGRLKDWLTGRSPRHAAALSGTTRLCAAVNQDYATDDHPVGPDDEVAFFPPVTGG